jgi:murein DD-endopeptidase MepM/ murein hydrolase activator NlpD
MNSGTLHTALSTLIMALSTALFTLGTPLQSDAQELKFAPAGGIITSEFGYRSDPFTKKQKFHSGLDIASAKGTPIYSPEAGTIAFSGEFSGYGNMVLIQHDRPGLYTVYGHCDKNLVQEKERVQAGQMVALMGSTGRSTGPHLHFEVHLNNQYMNPVEYLLYLQKEHIASGLIRQEDLNDQEANLAPTPLPPAMGGPDVSINIEALLNSKAK